VRDRLRAKGDRVPVVMISAHAYDDCLRKPFDGEVLLGAVRHATERTSN
jgi:DNA-binding response OmpR family regulator